MENEQLSLSQVNIADLSIVSQTSELREELTTKMTIFDEVSESMMTDESTEPMMTNEPSDPPKENMTMGNEPKGQDETTTTTDSGLNSLLDDDLNCSDSSSDESENESPSETRTLFTESQLPEMDTSATDPSETDISHMQTQPIDSPPPNDTSHEIDTASINFSEIACKLSNVVTLSDTLKGKWNKLSKIFQKDKTLSSKHPIRCQLESLHRSLNGMTLTHCDADNILRSIKLLGGWIEPPIGYVHRVEQHLEKLIDDVEGIGQAYAELVQLQLNKVKNSQPK